jgi:hypothetical protein
MNFGMRNRNFSPVKSIRFYKFDILNKNNHGREYK